MTPPLNPDRDVALLMPWRPTTPERTTLFQWATAWWKTRFPRLQHYYGDSPHEFHRSYARNKAANVADAAKIFVLADADTIPQEERVIEAIFTALENECCVLPYTTYYNLDAAQTKAILKKKATADLAEPTTWIHKLDDSVSGCVVVPKRVYWLVGGFDERFRNWGCEDRAFIESIEVLHKPIVRLPGYVQHLYHDAPESVRSLNPSYAANQALYERYQMAITKADMERVRFDL